MEWYLERFVYNDICLTIWLWLDLFMKEFGRYLSRVTTTNDDDISTVDSGFCKKPFSYMKISCMNKILISWKISYEIKAEAYITFTEIGPVRTFLHRSLLN